jgi:hypothetical protein
MQSSTSQITTKGLALEEADTSGYENQLASIDDAAFKAAIDTATAYAVASAMDPDLKEFSLRIMGDDNISLNSDPGQSHLASWSRQYGCKG